jgi:hypothetical protein
MPALGFSLGAVTSLVASVVLERSESSNGKARFLYAEPLVWRFSWKPCSDIRTSCGVSHVVAAMRDEVLSCSAWSLLFIW